MPSTIKVDQLAGATANTITVPSGQTLDISNATLSLPSNLVTTTGTQILTNKTINASQLTDASIALSKLSATGTASASTFLRGDNSWGAIVSGLTEADQWRLTTDFSSDAELTANLERVDTYGFNLLGTGMSQSSGVFTFPSTGYWLVMAQATILSNQYGNALLGIMVTTDNSTYNYSNQIRQGNAHYGYSSEPNATGSGFSIIKVTDTSNIKVKFRTAAFGTGAILRGDTNINVTSFAFIKLGNI